MGLKAISKGHAKVSTNLFRSLAGPLRISYSSLRLAAARRRGARIYRENRMGVLQTYEALDIPVAGISTGSDTTVTVPLNAASVGLTGSLVAVSRSNALADFTSKELVNDGYGRKVITWNKPERLANGSIGCVGTVAEFRPTGSNSPALAYNIFIVDSTGAKLLGAAVLDDSPVPMADKNSALVVTVIFNPITGGLVIDVD